MARVYNWNGRRYCYLGYVPIRRKNGDFVIRIGEHMVDLSRTTAYRICVGKVFAGKTDTAVWWYMRTVCKNISS